VKEKQKKKVYREIFFDEEGCVWFFW